MAKSNSTSVQVGPGGATLLTILFVILKVTGKIAWPWLWVFAPLWISAAVVLAILFFIVGIALLGVLL